MKFIFLIIIRIYWILIPITKRRHCIFEKSCSNIVYEETKVNGFMSGLKILVFRIKNCQSDFDIFTDTETGSMKMLLKTGVIVNEDQIAKRLK